MTKPSKMQDKFRARYGPWAVVTGASSGIGREIALYLAEAGLNLVLVARSRDVLEQIVSDVTARYGIEARVIDVDLAREKAVEEIEAETSNLDVGLLVAAAGFGTSGLFLDSTLEQEIEMLNVNCRALLSLSLHFGRRLASRGRGGIILMSSIVAFQGVPNSAHYAATKAYVQSLAESLHIELAPLGVDVLSSAPGPVHSGFAARADMRINGAMKPVDVAKTTLDSLGGKFTVLPGMLSKLILYSLAPLPRPMRARIVGMVMAGMTKHKHSLFLKRSQV
ncbi:MAG: SDR family oxidoreductase [Leptolyngbyaceae cyanobacterium CRU_2_3]|nr:SDR family oxidoreductase [Leptolyngbyaceae cyanobacterium CRU_2_3]